MQKELTYILGAGASYQSMPIVKSFSNRFQSFSDYLKVISSDIGFGQEKQDAFNLIYHKSIKLNEAFRSHQSFDTYFKKLFHTSEVKIIFEAKKILNLFFIWEHLSIPTDKPQIDIEFYFWKQSKIDKRYDALIAGLLKPVTGKSEPYCGVNFITWNYDLNLMISLKNYFSPNKTLGEFLSEIDNKNNTWQVGKHISVINMNGYFYSSKLSTLTDLEMNKQEIHDVIYDKIRGDYLDFSKIDSDSELKKFAWELDYDSNKIESEIVNIANEKIKLSNNIVIIGYTFPLYNRLVDFEYFNGSTLADKTIYVQDPNANELKNSLITDFNIRIEWTTGPRSVIKEFTKCDSFVIPSSIYKYKDKLTDI